MTFTLRVQGGTRFASKREALKAATPILVELIRLELEEEREAQEDTDTAEKPPT